jgi:hypothetical protein
MLGNSVGNSVPCGNTDSALETPSQLWIPNSAPGEPEPEIPNMRLSLYFHLVIYSRS